jgi:hypothetical protein
MSKKVYRNENGMRQRWQRPFTDIGKK